MARQMTEHDVARTTQAAAADDSPRLRKYDSSITLGAIAHQLSISSKEGCLAYDLRSIIQVRQHTHPTDIRSNAACTRVCLTSKTCERLRA